MATAEAERFILPKDDFMKLNRRQVGANMLPNPTQNPPSPAGQPLQQPAGQPPHHLALASGTYEGGK